MSCRAIAMVGLIVFSASASMAAANDAPTLFPREARKNPYASLFTGSSVTQQQRPPVRVTEVKRADKPKVVCGMVMIPADGSIDPHMRKSPPEVDDTTYTIRAVQPPMCWEK